MTTKLLEAIGVGHLTGYFEYLDDLRESGQTNMYGAASYLLRDHPGMTNQEANAVVGAWMKSFSTTLPPEDRVAKLLDAA
jgi:hypothetical protein